MAARHSLLSCSVSANNWLTPDLVPYPGSPVPLWFLRCRITQRLQGDRRPIESLRFPYVTLRCSDPLSFVEHQNSPAGCRRRRDTSSAQRRSSPAALAQPGHEGRSDRPCRRTASSLAPGKVFRMACTSGLLGLAAQRIGIGGLLRHQRRFAGVARHRGDPAPARSIGPAISATRGGEILCGACGSVPESDQAGLAAHLVHMVHQVMDQPAPRAGSRTGPRPR